MLTTLAGSDAFLVIDPRGGAVTSTIPLGGAVEAASLTPAAETLYASLNAKGRRELIAVDLQMGAVEWRRVTSTDAESQPIDGVALLSVEALTTFSASRMYAWRARSEDIVGIAALDPREEQVSAFSGPWEVDALLAITSPPPSTGPVLGVLGTRGDAAAASALYLVDPASLAVLDSITPSELGVTQIWWVLPAPDGIHLYITSSTELLRYDLPAREVTARVPNPATGSLTVTPDGATLVLSDLGDFFDFPGSGQLFVFNAGLELQGTIDVSTPLGGQPGSTSAIVTGAAVADPDNRTFYVRAGTGEVGPLFPPQPARLLVVDVVDRTLLRWVDLDGWGRGPVFVVDDRAEDAP